MIEPEEIPNNTKNTDNPYKKDIYESYVLWRSIPAFFRNSSSKKVADELGVSELEIIDLIGIKNQTEFAKKFNVEASTLSNWNKLIEKNGTISETRKWAKQLTKNIILSLYRKAIDTGDPERVKLFLEIVLDWSPAKSKREIAPNYQGIKEFIIIKK